VDREIRGSGTGHFGWRRRMRSAAFWGGAYGLPPNSRGARDVKRGWCLWAAACGRSTETLDDMPHSLARSIWTGVVVAVLAVPVTALAGGTDPPFLSAFREAFAAARALTLGSRPPPPALELDRLVHTSIEMLRTYLGPSTRLDCGDLLHVPVEACASFTYGPGPEPAVESPPGTITITTGGPWLLVVGISKGRVVEARWLGQR
jgi:hypothetical protein